MIELKTLFAAYSAVARTSDVSHRGAEAISEASPAENCDGEEEDATDDILVEAALRTTTIEVPNLDLARPHSLRSAKATASGSIEGGRDACLERRAQLGTDSRSERRGKKTL